MVHNENVSNFLKLTYKYIYFTYLFDSRTKDKIEMALFIIRYISTMFLFVLGLKAPGISRYNEDPLIDTPTAEVSVRSK